MPYPIPNLQASGLHGSLRPYSPNCSPNPVLTENREPSFRARFC